VRPIEPQSLASQSLASQSHAPGSYVTVERLLMISLLTCVGVGCFVVVRPFISAILWAAILVYSTWPLYGWLQHHLRLGRIGAAALMVAIGILLVVVPLALAVPSGADDAAQLRQELQNLVQDGLPVAPRWLWQIPVLGPVIGDIWNGWAADITAMTAFFKPYIGIAAEAGLSLLLLLANGVLQFLLALVIAFFFYASGERLSGVLRTVLERIAGPVHAARLIGVTGVTMRGVVYGLLGTAVMQGILTGLGLWGAGVPRPLLLGVIAGTLSVLPVGAPVVWIPAALWLLASGHDWRGALLFAYCLVCVSGSDSVIRPYFIARGARLPFLLTMLGVLGGALAFGLLGIFVGPVLLSLGYSLVQEFAHAAPAPTDPAELAHGEQGSGEMRSGELRSGGIGPAGRMLAD
jgi:predicted PurR-regulated permease PerM